jgi:hypothetical protein
MSLSARIMAALEAQGGKGALIGGGALAFHGVARATLDADFLTTDAFVLEPAFAEAVGVAGDERRGDPDDPLVGIVRFTDGDEVVDLIVGDAGWMKAAVERASLHQLSSGSVRVVEAPDLVLLKLYAGGLQDLLDVRLLVAAHPEIAPTVEKRLGGLPSEARQAWSRL